MTVVNMMPNVSINIRRAIQHMQHFADEFFHAYVVVPMWPEGIPTDGAVQEILAFQTETLQSVGDWHGSFSCVGSPLLMHMISRAVVCHCLYGRFIFVVTLAVVGLITILEHTTPRRCYGVGLTG